MRSQDWVLLHTKAQQGKKYLEVNSSDEGQYLIGRYRLLS